MVYADHACDRWLCGTPSHFTEKLVLSSGAGGNGFPGLCVMPS